MQTVDELHDTPSSVPIVAPDGTGADRIVHSVPLNVSESGTYVSALSMNQPTPTQAVEELHDSAVNLLVASPDGSVVAWIAHSVPFQCSAKLVVTPLLLASHPRLVHAVDDVQDTHLRTLRLAPLGVGVDWTAHSVPFQCSASVTFAPALFSYSPVKVQDVDDAQDTHFG